MDVHDPLWVKLVDWGITLATAVGSAVLTVAKLFSSRLKAVEDKMTTHEQTINEHVTRIEVLDAQRKDVGDRLERIERGQEAVGVKVDSVLQTLLTLKKHD